MIFICYPKCSTCMKAKNYLDNNNISYVMRDIVSDVPTSQELKKWIENSGKDISKFFKTSGLKYRTLDLKNKLPNMSFDEKIELLASDGMLIKRPILVDGNQVLIGFKEKEWREKYENNPM